MKKVLTVIILVVALQLAVVSASYAAPPAWGEGGGYYHHVMYGETMYSIGRMYNANPHCLAEYNGIWNADLIYAGEVLYIPTACTGYPWYAHQPAHYPGYGHDYGYGDCYSDCGHGYDNYNPHKPVRYGYDYTGYYYGHGKNRYSHTCGYYNNCW